MYDWGEGGDVQPNTEKKLSPGLVEGIYLLIILMYMSRVIRQHMGLSFLSRIGKKDFLKYDVSVCTYLFSPHP